MSTTLTGMRIWFVTVVLTVVLSCLVLLLQVGTQWSLDAIGVIFFMFIGGMVIGLPFLLLTIVLIRVIKRFPYGKTGKISWVFVVESIFVLLYYAGIEYILDGKFGLKDDFTQLIAGTTIAAFLLSLYINRTGFSKAVDGITVDIVTPNSEIMAIRPPGDAQNTTA